MSQHEDDPMIDNGSPETSEQDSPAGEGSPGRSPIEAMCFPHFATAAAAAALFEMKVRLVMDREDETRDLALKDLSVALDKLVSCFGHLLSDEEVQLLNGCGVLRNKLFHQELSRVTGKLRSLGEHLGDGGVWMANLETGAGNPVAATSTRNGRIVGWMLESTASGAFARATLAFERARETLSAILDRMDSEAIARQAAESREPILPQLERAIENMHKGARSKKERGE